MIPLHDNIRATTFPWVNCGLIAACSLVWIMQLRAGREVDTMIERWGLVPVRLVTPSDVQLIEERPVWVQTPFGPQVAMVKRELLAAGISDWFTLLSCIFLHGGWLHFLGNMWFLHIFGDNVEDRLGHLTYLLMYIGAGVFASVLHLVVNSDSAAPTIGASGAIAGVMGAYLLLFPRSRVLSLVPLIVIFTMIEIPAPVFLVVWFVMQFWNGTASIADGADGVAWWAHIGGFAAGFLIALGLTSVTSRSTSNLPRNEYDDEF